MSFRKKILIDTGVQNLVLATPSSGTGAPIFRSLTLADLAPIPPVSGQSGKVLGTNGTAVSWVSPASSSLTGFVLGADDSQVAATDTILQGLQKLQAQTNKKAPLGGVTPVTFGSVININLTTMTTGVGRITLTGPCTINITGGLDGQKFTLELLQDASGGRVASLGSGIAYGADITSYSGNTTANKRDILGFQYNTALGKAMLIAVAKGY